MDFGEGQQADKRQKTANGEAVGDGQIGGLASLVQYGSDDDDDAAAADMSTRPTGTAGIYTLFCLLADHCSDAFALGWGSIAHHLGVVEVSMQHTREQDDPVLHMSAAQPDLY